MDAAASLQELSLFRNLAPDRLALLAERVVACAFDAGEVIFRRGDPGGGLYLVIRGRVELFVTNTRGERLLLETVEAGGYFGELSFLDGEARSANALAVERTELLRLDREHLEKLITE